MEAKNIIYIGLGAVIFGALVMYSKKSQASPAMTTGWKPFVGTANPKPVSSSFGTAQNVKPSKVQQIEPVTWNPIKSVWQMGLNVYYPNGNSTYQIEWMSMPQANPPSKADWIAAIADDWAIPPANVSVSG